MGREITLASTKPVSALVCWATYAAAFAAVAAAFAWPLSPSPYWNGLAAMVAATLVIYGFHTNLPTSSMLIFKLVIKLLCPYRT